MHPDKVKNATFSTNEWLMICFFIQKIKIDGESMSINRRDIAKNMHCVCHYKRQMIYILQYNNTIAWLLCHKPNFHIASNMPKMGVYGTNNKNVTIWWRNKKYSSILSKVIFSSQQIIFFLAEWNILKYYPFQELY